MKELIEEYYQKFGKIILLTKQSDMEPIIEEADKWWSEKCLVKDYPPPRLMFKCKN